MRRTRLSASGVDGGAHLRHRRFADGGIVVDEIPAEIEALNGHAVFLSHGYAAGQFR